MAMPDVCATLGELDAGTQGRLADALETRGADPRQREMRRSLLADVEFPGGAEVVEVGCGTGVLTRAIAGREQVASVVGVDVAASPLDAARRLAADLPAVRFEEAGARARA